VHLASSYVVLPLFVLANAGVVLTGAVWHSSGGVAVIASIFAARTLGKALGITLGVALAVRLGLANLPRGTTWRHMVGVSLLCGMGLTVALLFAHAVFGSSPLLYSGAQIGLLGGPLGAAFLGAAVLLSARRPRNGRAEASRTGAAQATVPAADIPPRPTDGPGSSKEG
jgi:NhaA family Na+:H+ antiporter